MGGAKLLKLPGYRSFCKSLCLVPFSKGDQNLAVDPSAAACIQDVKFVGFGLKQRDHLAPNCFGVLKLAVLKQRESIISVERRLLGDALALLPASLDQFTVELTSLCRFAREHQRRSDGSRKFFDKRVVFAEFAFGNFVTLARQQFGFARL